MLSRRNFLMATAVIPAMVALTSCTAAQVNAALQQAAADASIIATGLKNILPTLGTVSGITPGVIASAGTFVADIQAAASAITAATTSTSALPSVQQLESALNGLVGVLASLPLPPAITAALQAASVLLPLIETAVGLVVAPRATTMSPAQARAVLLGR